MEDALDSYLTPVKENPSSLFEAMRYSVFSEGKRLRPILFFAVYEMLKGKKNANVLNPVLPVGCALEMIHTASLIHDDLPSVDNSDERRGQPTCHKKFDPATAILAGDALITKAFEMLTLVQEPEKAVRCINTMCRAVSTRGMIGGQAVDILSTDKNVRINVLRYVHLKKTGALLQAATDLACIMADAEDNITITIGNYALNLGLAYQVIDDILDEIGEFEYLGREPGEDYRNNKITYSSLLGLDKARKTAEKLLEDSYKMIKNMDNNEILVEFVAMIKDRLP